MLGVYTIVEPAAKNGWGDPLTLALSAASALLLVAFIVRESTTRNPLVPLRIFKSRNVSGANAIQALTVAGMFGLFFLGVLYLQEVLGYDALETGLAFLPTTLVMGTLSVRYAEPLIMRFGARRTLLPGLVLIALGLGLFAMVPVDGNYVTDVLPSTLLLGAGVGTCFPALMTLAMSGATREDAGLASGLVNTTAQVGAAIGLAVLATLSASRTDDLLAEGKSTAVALTGGYELAFWVAAGLVVAAIAVALTVLETEPPQGQEAEVGADHQTDRRAGEPAYSEAG
jgi:predicted MFS family arabinose efflux permease